MKRIIDTSEILGTVDNGKERFEVCATGDATYDEFSHKLSVKLDAFLRPRRASGKEERARAPWMPAPQNISESMDVEEATEVARDIFRQWVHRIRNAAPNLHRSPL